MYATPVCETVPELDPLHASGPRTIGLVAAVFILIVGFPAALLAFTGHPLAGAGLIVLFVGMVVLTGYWLKAGAELHGEDQGPR